MRAPQSGGVYTRYDARSVSSGVGAKFKDAMLLPGEWQIGATAFAQMLPNHANKAGETRTDRCHHRLARALPDSHR